eukprot:TRINITY_DN2500_c0_g1_i1.p1 TRINITY_DN2500_c0_g1~~TRINITY_DN2500_c0_g1_i1.p1  ORF type:complete len:164 (-),score=40.27 TRINITY_DN2500_c0_g1_i1:379-870(-)
MDEEVVQDVEPIEQEEEELECVTPGQRLGHFEEFLSGPGTYVRKGVHIHSSVVGFKRVIYTDGERPTLTVLREKEASIIPSISNIVVAKVTKVNPRFASLKILCVGLKPVKENFQGIIRVQDVRATEIDKVEIYKSFRPGDIVRAEVISLGDKRSYYLSTAKK